MIVPIKDFLPCSFDKTTLLTLQPYFDLDFSNVNPDQLQVWFENLYQVAKHDVGIAHCINQHQSSRNSLSAANQLSFGYAEKLGCFSVYHDVDTIGVTGCNVSGTKYWISSIRQADYVVCKVGRHDNNDRCLIFLDLQTIEHEIQDSIKQPVGLKVANPANLILPTQNIPGSWILHQGAFNSVDPQNQILSFLKFAFLTNFLGCAVGLLHTIESMIDRKKISMDFEIFQFRAHLRLLKQNWNTNLHNAYVDRLDHDYWIWHDTQYAQTKKCLTDMLKFLINVGSSRMYDLDTQEGKKFFDALMWASHGKPYYDQVMLGDSTTIR
jgi:hypothetical protein